MREAQIRRLVPILLATWFVVITVMRLILIAPGGPGFDGRLYRSATVAWLAGQDPWAVVQGGVYFGAPPPSLIPMIPFALLPETLGVGLMLVLCVVGSVWAIRRLGLPLWWLAFPPLVDGVWNANPHALVLPLLVAGGAVFGALAIVIKIYAAIVPAVRLEIRTLILAAVAIVVTAPFVPWSTYLAERQTIQDHLDATAGGGSSVWGLSMPILAVGLVVAVATFMLLLRRDRERAAWLAMPVFWPWTQWYYSSMAIPGVSDAAPERSPLSTVLTLAIAAAVLGSPIEGAPVIALAVVALGPLLAGAFGRSAATVPEPPVAGLP